MTRVDGWSEEHLPNSSIMVHPSAWAEYKQAMSWLVRSWGVHTTWNSSPWAKDRGSWWLPFPLLHAVHNTTSTKLQLVVLTLVLLYMSKRPQKAWYISIPQVPRKVRQWTPVLSTVAFNCPGMILGCSWVMLVYWGVKDSAMYRNLSAVACSRMVRA